MLGRVIRGYEDVVKPLASVPVNEKNAPQTPIVITHCGELELKGRNAATNPPSTPVVVDDVHLFVLAIVATEYIYIYIYNCRLNRTDAVGRTSSFQNSLVVRERSTVAETGRQYGRRTEIEEAKGAIQTQRRGQSSARRRRRGRAAWASGEGIGRGVRCQTGEGRARADGGRSHKRIGAHQKKV